MVKTSQILKELQAKLEALEAKNEKLEARLQEFGRQLAVMASGGLDQHQRTLAARRRPIRSGRP